MLHGCISLVLLHTEIFMDSAELNRYSSSLLDGRSVLRMRRLCGNNNDYCNSMCSRNSGRISR